MKKSLLFRVSGVMALSCALFLSNNSVYGQTTTLEAECSGGVVSACVTGSPTWVESFGNFTSAWGDHSNANLSGTFGRRTSGATANCATTGVRGRYILVSDIPTGGAPLADGLYDITLTYYDLNNNANTQDGWFYVGPSSAATTIVAPPPATDPNMDVAEKFTTADVSGTKFTKTYTNVDLVATDAIYMFTCTVSGAGSTGNLVFDNITLTPASVTSTSENADFSNKIKLYPNPASNQVSIESNGMDLSDGKVKIANVQGSVVLESEYSNNLDVSKMKSGIYMLSITTENKTAVKRLVIE